jgi:predicted Ser/Thr protein kinase
VSDEGPRSPFEIESTLHAGPSSDSEGELDTEVPQGRLLHSPTDKTHDVAPTIGRFSILHKLGQGGMGVVYLGYDPRLDRRAAVKLLHAGRGDDVAQARLLREAQALARLSHPNVVQIYESGEHGDDVYIAMEFIDGRTLRDWLRASEHSIAEILEVFAAAGRGLQTAHDRGLTHRDFKPDNVMVGVDGRVTVMDFGLVRPREGSQALDREQERVPERPSSGIDLTMTGALLGTPAYMAPEQYAGSNVDARTDQFAFCVSLYEALYAERPFAGNTLAELILNVQAGIIQQPSRFEQVPAWLRRVLLRGLSVDPEQRYPSITQLLAALGRDPARRRRQALVGLVVAGLVMAVAFAWDRASEDQRAWAEGEQLRVEFGRARASNAEDELRRLRRRTVTQRWDDLVLAWANDRVDDDPTRALASLRYLQDLEANLGAARTIAADAWRRGVARESIDLSGDVLELEVAPDGDLVATLVAGSVVHAWDRSASERLPTWDCPEPATALAIAPHAPSFAVGAKSGTIFLVEFGNGRVHSFAAHEGPVHALAFSADGSVLASAGADHAVRRWTATTGERVDAMTNHDAPVVALSYDLGTRRPTRFTRSRPPVS